jgi:capsule polysaccharide export protein KpsC/LpsZ
MLPENVKIYVKENPKQMGFMRGPTFFHRINRLKNIELIPENINSHELIRNCVFVAAITGTAGWEALSIGRPALVFGNAWYRSLPGAVKYSVGLTYDEIIAIKTSHESLEKAVGQLHSRMHDGVIDRHYKGLVSGYNNDNNVVKIAETIEKLISNNHPYTFD